MSGGRQRGPDQLRGLLLTLVIFGHTYAAGFSEDRSKWIIYGFHMPLFFAVSGWLLSRSSLTRRSLPELLSYYWRRMIWQWLLVSVVFGLWKGKLPASPKDAIDVLLFEPLFHLWFIPALLIMVVVTQVVLRAGCGWRTLAAVAATSFVIFELPWGRPFIPESLSSFDHRYGAYFIWFLLGFAVRNATWSWPQKRITQAAGLALATAGAAVYIDAYHGGSWQHDIGFALLNTGLIALLPLMFAALSRPLPLIGDAMTRVGRGSLWIYLLHPFLTELWRPHDHGGWRSRVAGLLITAAIVAGATVLSHLLTRRRLGERHASGSTSVRPEDVVPPPVPPVAGRPFEPGEGTPQSRPEPIPARSGGPGVDIRSRPVRTAEPAVFDLPDAPAHPRQLS